MFSLGSNGERFGTYIQLISFWIFFFFQEIIRMITQFIRACLGQAKTFNSSAINNQFSGWALVTNQAQISNSHKIQDKYILQTLDNIYIHTHASIVYSIHLQFHLGLGWGSGQSACSSGWASVQVNTGQGPVELQPKYMNNCL